MGLGGRTEVELGEIVKVTEGNRLGNFEDKAAGPRG